MYRTGNTPASLVSEEFQVQQGTPTAGPATQHFLPSGLLLIAVRKRNMDVFQREIVVGKFFQAENVRVLGSILDPRPFIDEAGADLEDSQCQSAMSRLQLPDLKNR